MACFTDKSRDFSLGQMFNYNFPSYEPHETAESKDEDTTSDKIDKCGEMMFCIASHLQSVMKMIFAMRSHHMLTDIMLEVGPEVFHAHKLVLAAASPYFKAMFTGGLKECEMSKVKLQGVCPIAMAKLIKFMYTGKLRVTEATVWLLLAAASMFQIGSVVEACCAFLEKQLHPSNAIGIGSFAEQYCCKNLHHKAKQFIIQHFNQVCQEEEFLQLSAFQLVTLVSKDELNIQDECEVYNAVLKWVKYNEEARGPKMEKILQAVRCPLLTPSFIRDQMRNCDLLKKVPACREYLQQIFEDLTLHKKPIVKKRIPNIPRVIFVAGGNVKRPLDLLESFNIDTNTWLQHEKLLIPRTGLGGAFLKGMFYTVGGRHITPEEIFDTDFVHRYNPITNQWRPCCFLSVPRHRPGVAVMDGLLYAVGGSDITDYHNSVEYYDPDCDTWTFIKPMHYKRSSAGVTVVNRLLYVIGGFDGCERLKSAECYHPENDEWTLITPMQDICSGAGVASIGQYIYVVGGFDGKNFMKTVQRYDIEKDVWDYVSPLKIGRSGLSVIVLDEKLYAMGGYDGINFLDSVEIYDPIKNEWEEGTPMTFSRSGHTSAISYQHCPVHCESSKINEIIEVPSSSSS